MKSFTLSPQAGLRIADSLRVLPLVRQEAAMYRRAYLSADSAGEALGRANAQLRVAYRDEVAAVGAKDQEVAAERLQTAFWKATAQRRGRLAGVLGTVATAGTALLYFTFLHR